MLSIWLIYNILNCTKLIIAQQEPQHHNKYVIYQHWW